MERAIDSIILGGEICITTITTIYLLIITVLVSTMKMQIVKNKQKK